MDRKPPSKRWLGVLAGIVLACALCAAALFAATWLLTGGTAALVTPYDVLARPGEPAVLRVKLQRGVGLRDAEDEIVEFRIPGGETMTAMSDGQGVATGEALFDAISREFASASAPHQAGSAVRVFVRPAHVRIAVCDVDHTLADISAARVIQTPNEQTSALPGSAEVLSRLAQTHLIVYLTARDDKLLNKTRQWLAMNGYPDGPVFARDLGSDPLSARKFKTAWLTAFKASWANVEYGFGDRDEDAAAYHAAGIKSYIVRAEPFDPGGLPASAHEARDWAAIGAHLFGTN